MDYQSLPKLRDSISYIYLEHAMIEQSDASIMAVREDGRIPIPVSAVTCVLLGPGTSITHAAIKTASENGCMLVWCGEGMQRFYALGTGETHNAENLLLQAKLCSDDNLRLEVAKRMYIRRFGNITSNDYDLKQLRGMEGIRVREAYRLASRVSGVPWKARSYKSGQWDDQDPINMALSQANAILYSICHAAIVSLGYSPGLGFIHTGKQLSFVYDVADLYKTEITIPAAFFAVKHAGNDLACDVRRQCRNRVEQGKLLKRIPEDLEWIFRINDSEHKSSLTVGELWDPKGNVSGGYNQGKGEQ